MLLAVETGVILGWHKRAGDQGDVIVLDRLGAPAPTPVVMRECGLTAEHVCQPAPDSLAKRSP